MKNNDIEARAERDRERVTRATERSKKESKQKLDSGPSVNLTRGDTIQPESIEWLWPDWLSCMSSSIKRCYGMPGHPTGGCRPSAPGQSGQTRWITKYSEGLSFIFIPPL